MSDILKKLGFTDVELGNIQSVDEMTVLPILGKDRTEKASKPDRVKFRRTRGYGQMVFDNEDSENTYGIVPTNTMVLSEKAAQDHAMSDSGVVKGGSETTFENACCVQQTQCGYLNESGNEFNVLPLGLRHALLSPSKRYREDFSKLWGDIETWLEDIPNVEHSRGHLEYFFKPYHKELEDFVAEFEPVENQLGALVFFNDKAVGLEIMPTVEHWNYYWKWLIRGCYGSQLIKLRDSGKLKAKAISFPETENLLTDFSKYFDTIKTRLVEEFEKNTLNLNSSTRSKYSMTAGTKKQLIMLGAHGGGDIIYEGTSPVYISAVI